MHSITKQVEAIRFSDIHSHYKQLLKVLITQEKIVPNNLLDEQYLIYVGVEKKRHRNTIIKVIIENSEIFLNIKKEEMKVLFEKPLSEWSEADVLVWLKSISMENYQESFRKQKIKGINLVNMDDNLLKSMGVSPLGHRKKLLRKIHIYTRN